MNDDEFPGQEGPQLPGWDLGGLRNSIERVHGRDQACLAWKCSQSIVKRLGYMEYHYREADRLVNSALKETRSDDVLMKYVMPSSDPEARDYQRRRFHSEAHLIAFMQSGHAILDTLAHVIYFALNFDHPQPSKVALHTVHAVLPIGSLKELSQNLIDDVELKHLAAMVNVSKHRTVVQASTSVSFVEDEMSHGLKFEGFKYKGGWFPARWAVPFAHTVFDRLQLHVFRIGAALKEHVDHLPSSPPAGQPRLQEP